MDISGSNYGFLELFAWSCILYLSILFTITVLKEGFCICIWQIGKLLDMLKKNFTIGLQTNSKYISWLSVQIILLYTRRALRKIKRISGPQAVLNLDVVENEYISYLCSKTHMKSSEFWGWPICFWNIIEFIVIITMSKSYSMAIIYVIVGKLVGIYHRFYTE